MPTRQPSPIRFAMLLATPLALAMVLLPANDGFAQNSARSREFIESSSPLRDGSSVTSRSVAGGQVQTKVELANLPTRSAAQAAAFDRYNNAGNQRQTLRPTPTSASTGGSIRQTYSYPQPARTQQNLGNRVASNTGPSVNTASRYQTPSTNANRRTAYQISPYQVGGYRTAQNCNCGPGQVQAPPANFAPTLDIQVPGVTDTSSQQAFQLPATGYGGNTLGLPPVSQTNGGIGSFFGGNNGAYGNRFRNWWSPLVTGSGAYQPIIRLQNLNPGTYLGQGIIGQPTAYVDGQPVRNLLRYISP